MPRDGFLTETGADGCDGDSTPRSPIDRRSETAPFTDGGPIDDSTAGPGSDSDRIAELEAEVRSLERRLARSEAARQNVIDRYERLLSAHDPATFANRPGTDPDAVSDPSLLARLRRLVLRI
ncbi:hypothetical protein [Halegenticoccus tardaugens]|uniref:hypothetical protein n=1 Tax=Halegenticoccus tardaugens TaxID=2071624 RepID=UPI00100C1897|nr:hypothetical protein [Halegenticoccus tardaugens]